MRNTQRAGSGDPRTTELWPVWVVAGLSCGRSELWPVWVVAGLGCGRSPTEPPRLTARSQKTPTHARKMRGQETLA
jgi:hypothetical protein